jgi:hypothetical protein
MGHVLCGIYDPINNANMDYISVVEDTGNVKYDTLKNKMHQLKIIKRGMKKSKFKAKYGDRINKMINRNPVMFKDICLTHPNVGIFTYNEIHDCTRNYAVFHNKYIQDVDINDISKSSAGFMGWLDATLYTNKL